MEQERLAGGGEVHVGMRVGPVGAVRMGYGLGAIAGGNVCVAVGNAYRKHISVLRLGKRIFELKNQILYKNGCACCLCENV